MYISELTPTVYPVKKNIHHQRRKTNLSSIWGSKRDGGENHDNFNTHNILHVVHYHQCRHDDCVDNCLGGGPEFHVSHANQVVPHAPRNLQRDRLLGPRDVQDCLCCFQSRPLCGAADRPIEGSIRYWQVTMLASQVFMPVSHPSECRFSSWYSRLLAAYACKQRSPLFLGLPAATKRSYMDFIFGSYWIADNIDTYNTVRTLLRPPYIRRLPR